MRSKPFPPHSMLAKRPHQCHFTLKEGMERRSLEGRLSWPIQFLGLPKHTVALFTGVDGLSYKFPVLSLVQQCCGC
jgi:hypothetical protein